MICGFTPRPLCAGAFVVSGHPRRRLGDNPNQSTRRHAWPRLTRPPRLPTSPSSSRSRRPRVVTEYRGLTVANLADLRKSLGESATYTVAKNTLVKRAASEAGIEGLDELFTGPTAIAFIKGEPVDAAKAIKTFAKDNKALVIKGGYMDGQALTVSEVERIADLESREVLLAKLAGAMKAKTSQAAALFAAPASQIARLAAALQEKKAAGEPAALPPKRASQAEV